jgi:hypothetical protein
MHVHDRTCSKGTEHSKCQRLTILLHLYCIVLTWSCRSQHTEKTPVLPGGWWPTASRSSLCYCPRPRPDNRPWTIPSLFVIHNNPVISQFQHQGDTISVRVFIFILYTVKLDSLKKANSIWTANSSSLVASFISISGVSGFDLDRARRDR